ncbi:MAG: hypothetical protein GY903_18920 [Fuerstiella sp.]|nr:hypothetical protein [Fuerstiella sp.]MCP4856558.1 hypothetical protein [Fuerstiella sp.]
MRKIIQKYRGTRRFPYHAKSTKQDPPDSPSDRRTQQLVLEKLTHQVNIQQIPNNLQIRVTTSMPPGCGVDRNSVNLDVGRIAHESFFSPSFAQLIPQNRRRPTNTPPKHVTAHATPNAQQSTPHKLIVGAQKKRLTVKQPSAA